MSLFWDFRRSLFLVPPNSLCMWEKRVTNGFSAGTQPLHIWMWLVYQPSRPVSRLPNSTQDIPRENSDLLMWQGRLPWLLRSMSGYSCLKVNDAIHRIYNSRVDIDLRLGSSPYKHNNIFHLNRKQISRNLISYYWAISRIMLFFLFHNFFCTSIESPKKSGFRNSELFVTGSCY